MKRFACGSVVPGCSSTFTADTEEGVLGLVAVHAREQHGIGEIGDEPAGAVRAHIHDVE